MNRLKLLREEKELLQSDIGKILGVTSNAIGYYENGKRDIPTEYVIKLAEYFNVSTDYLLGKSDIRNPEEQIKNDFEFAYHKEIEGLTEEEISDALRFYKEMKKRVEGDKK